MWCASLCADSRRFGDVILRVSCNLCTIRYNYINAIQTLVNAHSTTWHLPSRVRASRPSICLHSWKI